MTGLTTLPRPHGATSSGFVLDFDFPDLPSPSSGKFSSSAIADTDALASAFSAASSEAAPEPGGGANGAGSMVAIGCAPNSGTSADTTPLASLNALGATLGAAAVGAAATTAGSAFGKAASAPGGGEPWCVARASTVASTSATPPPAI